MASEITVSFEDGSIFNGFASSLAKNGETTYYFDIDKPFRVQVSEDGSITLQQYKNTNGSWYNINIIKKVEITPISGGGGGDVTIEYLQKNYYSKTEIDETLKEYVLSIDLETILKTYVTLEYLKENYTTTIDINAKLENYVLSVDLETILKAYITLAYLEQNYYNKTYIDNLVFDTGVTLQYLQANYYSKTETDGKYVKKSGDTMTGALVFDYDNYKLSILSDRLTIESIDESTKETTRLLQLYRNNVNVYQGNIYMRLGGTGSLSGASINNNGFFIYDSNNISIGYMQQENNRGTVGLHIFNNSRIVLHSGKPGTVEPFIQLQEDGINGYNDAILKINALLVSTNKVTFNSDINSNAAATFNKGLTSKGNILVDSTSSNSQTTISPNNIRIESDTNYTTYNADAIYIYKGSSLDVAIRSNRGVDVYNGGSMIIHGGTGDKQTAYTYLGFNTYNLDNNDTWSMNMGNSRFEFRNAYTAIFYSNNLMRLQAGNSLTLSDNDGTIVVRNATKALNNAFFGDYFLNALNALLKQIQDNIKATSPAYQIVSAINFDSQDYGGGFAAGGGSSRGGGVGRR